MALIDIEKLLFHSVSFQPPWSILQDYDFPICVNSDFCFGWHTIAKIYQKKVKAFKIKTWCLLNFIKHKNQVPFI